MTIRFFAAACALFLATSVAEGQDFYQYWGDGRAEVSSYSIVQPRYGEPRQGHGVLIFVTEDVNAKTLIKVESPTPKEQRIYSLKLNNVLKFTTGIYPYSVMTSVFSSVEPRTGQRPFELLKLNLSSQEWCGHVFEEVRVEDGQLRGDLNSYFEKEGRQQWRLDVPTGFVTEDHLLIRIRELHGQWLAEGETRRLTMLPSLWRFRLLHKERGLVQASVTKGSAETIKVADRSRQAVPWTWSFSNYEKTVWVEAEYPHRILRWKDSMGATGELLVSQRLPYWSLNGTDDERLRGELKIPGGAMR